MAPVIRYIAGTVLDPGAGGIEHRRLIHDAGALAFEPVVEPVEIWITRREIGLVDKGVLVRANPQFLIADPRLNVVERRQHAGLEDIEPGGHMKTGNVDGATKIVPRPEIVRGRVGDDLIEIRLPGGKIWVASQRQAHPDYRLEEREAGAAGCHQ